MKTLRTSIWFALLTGTIWFALCVLATCLDYKAGFSALLFNGLISVDVLLSLSERLTESQLNLYLGSELVVTGVLLASWLGAIVWAWLIFWGWRWLVQRHWTKLQQFLLQLFSKHLARRI